MTEISMTFTHGAPAALIRRKVDDVLRHWNVTRSAADVLLVCTELVQNVTQHTADGGELRLLLRPDSIMIEVTDTSPCPPQLPEVDLLRLGGRGLLLIATIAIAWGSRARTWAGHLGKVVWAELALTPTG